MKRSGREKGAGVRWGWWRREAGVESGERDWGCDGRAGGGLSDGGFSISFMVKFDLYSLTCSRVAHWATLMEIVLLPCC